MRLLSCLMKKIMPNGHIFIGRHRLQYAPDARARDRMRWALQVEEENMLYLRHPYLTEQQSKGHMAHVVKKYKIIEQLKKKERQTSFWKSVRLEDKLNHLRHGESWGE